MKVTDVAEGCVVLKEAFCSEFVSLRGDLCSSKVCLCLELSRVPFLLFVLPIRRSGHRGLSLGKAEELNKRNLHLFRLAWNFTASHSVGCLCWAQVCLDQKQFHLLQQGLLASLQQGV